MGLLDEAIKQHLELKRRRGADPGEIERLEREALGPVRRLQQEAPSETGSSVGPEDVAYEEPEYGEEPYEEGDLGPENGYEPLEDELAPPSGPSASESEAPHDSEPGPDFSAAHGVVPPEEEPFFDHATEPEASLGPPTEDLGVETVEYDVEAEHARETGHPEGEEDDPLEETPEFFQDAPDHDRLWFEQRPPKDFDFEG